MSYLVPDHKPRLTRDEAHAILKDHSLHSLPATGEPVLIGLRGYYRDTMGERGKNDRGIYDDAIILLSRDVMANFNANVDPSVYRLGIATLVPGVWRYKLGIHGLSRPKAQQYQALVQADQVTVHRDGRGFDRGWFGINIHRGGATTTSSLGCQTIPPDQWPAFIALVKQEMQRSGKAVIPYLLVAKA